MSDLIFTEVFDTHFEIESSSDYGEVLSALKMKEGNFNRTLVKIYCSDFLDALEMNPNFSDPDRGGTTMKLINVMFVSGLKSDLFRQNIERHGTEDTSSTFKAITKLFPQFQKSNNMRF